jgi:hypothetical protein
MDALATFLTTSWVERDAPFLATLDIIAIAGAIVYAVVYFREKTTSARPRRMRSAAISAIALTCFAVFLAVRVFVLHD